MSSPSLLPQRLFETPINGDPRAGGNEQPVFMRNSVWQRTLQTIATPGRVPQLVVSTHALRIKTAAGNYADGSLFYETDRTLYYISRSGSWFYYSGIWSLAQVQLAAIVAGDLGANDVGLLAYLNDFAHLLQWTGTNWTWAPADIGSGLQAIFPDAATRPPGVGWQVCDGSTVQVLNSDGSYSMITVPVVGATTFYRQ